MAPPWPLWQPERATSRSPPNGNGLHFPQVTLRLRVPLPGNSYNRDLPPDGQCQSLLIQFTAQGQTMCLSKGQFIEGDPDLPFIQGFTHLFKNITDQGHLGGSVR